MPENLYPKLPSVPLMSQEGFNVEMIKKCYKDIMDLRKKYYEKERKYKNAYNKLLHASTGESSVGVISGLSITGTAFTVVGTAFTVVQLLSLGVIRTVSTCRDMEISSWSGISVLFYDKHKLTFCNIIKQTILPNSDPTRRCLSGRSPM